jgi:undecaprenyl pyrophosphate phosphatase UppP
MTTFQVLVESFLKALTTILPVSSAPADALTRNLLEWTLPVEEIGLLVLLTSSLVLLLFFRYDWLALLSAGLTSVFRPASLKEETRSLDQHTLVFILIALIPARVLGIFFGAELAKPEGIPAPVVSGLGLLLTGILFFASARWNKRIHGLNHLRMIHVAAPALAGVLSLLPGFPPVGLLWIAFAFCNYHYEAVFKFSALLAALGIFISTILSFQNHDIREVVREIGYLNSGAAIVVVFTVLWISLESFQKSLSANSMRNFQWLSFASGAVMLALYFLNKIPE